MGYVGMGENTRQGAREGKVDVNALLVCPNAREGMTEVALSLVLIHRIEKQQHHHTHACPPPCSLLQSVDSPFLYSLGAMEPMDIVGKAKEDASLPKATMTKIIKEMLPPDVRVARDAQDLLIECCVEFINLISSESNEVCNKEERRTIAPEHVLKALGVLGFGEYIEEVYAAYEQHKLETMQDSIKGAKWSNRAEMTEEEALAEQQRMFAEARARMNGGAITSKQPDADQSLES
ncbi:Protein Dr1-like protein, partial [Mucuna pruriens]